MMKIFKNIENKYRKPVAGTHGEAQHRRAHGLAHGALCTEPSKRRTTPMTRLVIAALVVAGAVAPAAAAHQRLNRATEHRVQTAPAKVPAAPRAYLNDTLGRIDPSPATHG
jgi:hypothetical protein